MKDSQKIEAEAKEGGETSPNEDSSLNQRHQRQNPNPSRMSDAHLSAVDEG